MNSTNIVIYSLGMGVAYLLMRGVGKAEAAVANLETTISFGGPKFDNFKSVKLPVKVLIHNFQNVNLKIDNIKVTAERLDATGNWIQFAFSLPTLNNFVIRAQSSTEVMVEMEASLLGLAYDLFDTVYNVGKKQLRINVIPTVMGVVLEPKRYIW